MLGHEVGHLAGAEQQRRAARQLAEYPARQLHRREGDRDRVAGDAGLGPHTLRRCEAMLQETFQDRPGGAALPGREVGLLDLPLDLGLFVLEIPEDAIEDTEEQDVQEDVTESETETEEETEQEVEVN